MPRPLNAMKLKAGLRKVRFLVPLVHACRFALDPGYRSERRLMRDNPENLFQPVSKTAFDRYPRIFSFISERLSGASAVRLLSFGCSTGEEVFTLRQYFPEAEIVGIDINPRSIAVCRKKLKKMGEQKIRFELANSTDGEPEGHYDAIFCMSVLRHGGLGVSCPEKCEDFILFAEFEKTVAGLARVLKLGGYLAIMNSNFRFSDTAMASEFETVYSRIEQPRADTPIYDRENHLLPHCVYGDLIFRSKSVL